MSVMVYIVLAVCLGAVLYNPAYALAATLMVFAFEQFAQFHAPIFVVQPALINVLFAAFVVIAMVRRKMQGQTITGNISHATLLLATMYVLHPISALWSPDPDTTLARFLQTSPYIVVLNFLTSLVVGDLEDLDKALKGVWIFGASLLLLILATVDFAEYGRGIELHATIGRSEVQEANPLALAGAGGTVAITSMVLQPGKGWRMQFMRGITAAMGLYICVRTGSRGQFLAALITMAVAVAVQTWVGRTRVWKTAILSIVGVALVGWLLARATEQFGNRFAVEEMQAVYEHGRVGPSEGLLRIWASSGPWAWVWGLGGSSSYYHVGFYPHVVPVEVLTELGAIGLLLYLGFAVLVVMRFRWLLDVTPPKNWDTVTCACALFAFEWILALKQGAVLAADMMMCHGLVVCGVAQTWKRRMEMEAAFEIPEQAVSARERPAAAPIP